MSSCPTKDIHSIYLDNELPLSYAKEYEAHIQSCSECAAELERLKKVRELMSLGNPAELTQQEMDESFRRLQSRMAYSKHSKLAERKPVVSNVFRFSVPAMAAAAVFALVLPVGLKAGRTNKSVSEPLTAKADEPVFNTVSSVAPIRGNTVGTNQMNRSFMSMRNMERMNRISRTTEQSEVYPQVVDVFCPNFDNGNNISIKITIPGINAVPYTTEIDVPVDMYKGNLSEKD